MNRPSAWGTDWFLGLKLPLRLAWQYIVAHVDRGGFFDLAQHQHVLRLVCELPSAQVLAGLNEQVIALAPTLWQVKGWVPEQYPRDYAAKPNGVQVAVLKELRRRASVFGEGVILTAFDGFPAWPELQAQPAGGGGPRVDLGPQERPGRATPGPTPPVIPSEDLEQEDAESKDAPTASFEDVLFASLSSRWELAGYPGPDWPPFTKKTVTEAARRLGGDAVDLAAKRYLDAGGADLTPKRFGNELGDWLRTVPMNRRRCLQGHAFEGALLAVSDFPQGPLMRSKRCTWCGHTEHAGPTKEASIETQPCAHVRTSKPDPALARAGRLGDGLLCMDCGETVQGVRP